MILSNTKPIGHPLTATIEGIAAFFAKGVISELLRNATYTLPFPLKKKPVEKVLPYAILV